MFNGLNKQQFHFFRFFCLIMLVGIVAGIGAIVFRELIGFFHNLLFYGEWSTNYDVLKHAAPSRWGMGIILVPVVGAVVVAFLVKNFAPEARGHGVPEVMDAIYYERGKVRPIVAFVKAIASSISIGSGGSVGREGPIIQIGAAFGSTIGQIVKVPDWQRITLIACGAGAGIAATFNTPFGGILFAVEIMLPELSARTIIPIILATVIGTYTSYLYFGNTPFIPFPIETYVQMSTASMISYILLSIVLGISSVIFIHCIYLGEDIFESLHDNYYVQHILGMLLVGISMYLMMLFFGHYYIQGVGYATVVDVLSKSLTAPLFLLFLAALKMIETSITIGSGGSGGIFSPLLFIGATLGAGFAACLNYFFPGTFELSLQLGALAGMAGMVGASTAAPMTAIIMTAELTHDFTVILPLMLIVGLAYGIRRSLMRNSVYTLKLSRRGHHIPDVMQTHIKVMRD